MIHFRMLGTVGLTGADGRELRGLLAQTRRLALLAYLAAARPRDPVRRDRLLTLFWPELDQEHARAALRQALHVLRAALGAGALATPGEDVVLLERDAVWCDVVAFDDAIRARRQDEALELYRGDFLDAFFIGGAPDFERWVESERTRLSQDAAGAARTLIDAAERSGDAAAAAGWARRALRFAPVDEEIVRRLMVLLERMGEAAGALHEFGELSKRLAAEIDGRPDPSTQALANAIRQRQQSQRTSSAAVAAVVPRAGAGPHSRSERRRRRWPLALLALSAALVLLRLSGRLGDRVTPGAASTTARVESVAVLPLEDLSGEKGPATLADAVTEALTANLGRTPGLRVISRRSSSISKASSKPMREIAADLKVDALVEGSVHRAGDGMRIDLRLIRARTGEQMWSASFEGSTADGLSVEDAASRALRSALGFVPAGLRVRLPTVSAEAHDLYLRGRIRVQRENPEDDSAAIALLERAVTLDPGFAAAHAALAYAYGLRVAQFAPDDAVALERAEVAARNALRLDPDLPESHYAAGRLFWGVLPGRFSHERAAREFKRAIELNPNFSEAHHFLGQIYLHSGLLDEAVAELQKSLSLDPMDDNALRRIGIAQVYQGRYEEGLRTFRQVPPLANSSLWHYQVAWVLLYLGRNGEATALIEQYLRAHPEDRGGVVTSTRAIWFAKSGDRGRAEEDIQSAIEKGKGFVHFHHSAYNIASAYALLGQPQPALRWLRETADTGWPCYPYFATDPNLEPIRGDPRYSAFMEDLKARWERYRANP